MPLVLAVDTAGYSASVGLFCIGEGRTKTHAIAGSEGEIPHSERLLPLIDEVLTTAGASVRDVDLFAVNAGPGSFTGIRIGVSAVKGLAFAAGDVPCAPVSATAA